MRKVLKKIKIQVIATYKEMEEDFNNIFYENIELKVKTIDNMREIESIVKECEEDIDVFLSRGAVVKIIEKISSIPAVRIPITNFDLIKAIYEGKEYNKGKIGFLSYMEDNYNIKEIEKILNVEVVDLKYESLQEQEKKLEVMNKLGVKVIVGGGLTPIKAKKLGLDSILLKSGNESIMTSIKNAINIVNIRRKERGKTARLNAILDSINQGLIVTDAENKINLYNPAAEKIIDKPRKEVLEKNINEIIPTVKIDRQENKVESTELHYINGEIIAISTTPIILDNNEIGIVSTFDKSSNIQKIEKKIRENLHKKGLVAKYTFNDIKTRNEIMIKLKEIAKLYAKTDETVLINGESGTGKELIAQSIHNESSRRNNPFVAINCAAISENLLESELFGYEGGAFTGAKKEGKQGLFELAHKGTIFLDEIGEISKHLQSSLLRVIQEKEVMRVGGDNVIPIDIRIICATNRNLEAEIAKGNFREDLYYRLNVLYINVPPLRERKEDIYIITENALEGYENRKQKKEDILDILGRLPKNYEWKGNIRELESLVRRAYLMNKLPKEYKENIGVLLKGRENILAVDVDISNTLKQIIRKVEKEVIDYYIEKGQSMEEILKKLEISRASYMRKK